MSQRQLRQPRDGGHVISKMGRGRMIRRRGGGQKGVRGGALHD